MTMSYVKLTAATLVLALGLAACNPAADQHGKVDIAAAEQAIRAKETAWMAAYNRHDADGLAGQYEADASLASSGAALMTNAGSRNAFLKGFASDPALKVDFASDRIIVAASGDLASSRGHYTMTFTDPATKVVRTEKGHYLTVYRKGTDGQWNAIEDFTTPGPAVVPAAAAQ